MASEKTELKESASQTAGPYVHIGLAPGAAGFKIYREELGWDIAGPEAAGERIRVEGVIFDGEGELVKDALLEVWQADASGRYASAEERGQNEPGFRGWGRVITDFDDGTWSFDTIKPGPVEGPDGKMMAPHISLWIVARGINIGLSTRLYFSDESEANAADPILDMIEPAERRGTLVAQKADGDGPAVYRFDIRLQGDGETVFFDI